ncbi:MAG: hypothetical protein ACJAZO_002418 [Myxococcota bacterium]|jgi:hypothetical protein
MKGSWLVMLLWTPLALAAPPSTIPFQTRVAGVDGIGLTQEVSMMFSLFAVPTGGSAL